MKTNQTHDTQHSQMGELGAECLTEPPLKFAGDRLHVDPKTGIARYGPASLGEEKHPADISIGFVGSGRTVDAARRWLQRTSQGVTGDTSNSLPDFPGFLHDRGFFSSLRHPSELVERITAQEIRQLMRRRRVAHRFEDAVCLVSEKLRLLSQRDQRPDLVILALPDDLVRCTARVKFSDPDRGVVFRNLRRALKAEVMRHGLPTQILLPRVTEARPDARNVDHISRVAWNLYTGMFYKAGGVPWRPTALRADTCYVGVSFYRPLGSTDNRLHTAVAQAFDDLGVGLILRGPDFQWDRSRDGPSPHLEADAAKHLLELVLRRYRAEVKREPARVVVHKTSRFWSDELAGFQDALKEIDQFDLVAVRPTSELRLTRAGNYPPLRGTLFSLGSFSCLYTTGYISALRTYPHGHVPSPLQIADHHGDTAVAELANEILVLTKMNWNSAGFAGALPITVRFSQRVGDIMREIPEDREPAPQFKFYI